jgi:hypothetical protein
MGKGGKGGGSRQAANNRSNSMNPNNAAHRTSANNRSNQMNPNNPAYGSSRSGSSSGRTSGGGGSAPAGWTARPGCELCENSGPHDGPHGYFQEGEFFPFPDGEPEDEDEE